MRRKACCAGLNGFILGGEVNAKAALVAVAAGAIGAGTEHDYTVGGKCRREQLDDAVALDSANSLNFQESDLWAPFRVPFASDPCAILARPISI